MFCKDKVFKIHRDESRKFYTCLMATPSGKVAQMLAFTTSMWGLNREAHAALFRVKTRLECPEGNMRELMRDTNSN